MQLGEDLAAVRTLFDVRLFEIAGTPITAWTLALLLAVGLLLIWLSRAVQRAVVRLLKLGGVDDHALLSSAPRIAHYVVVAIGFGVALHTVGINLGAVFAAGAVTAVAVGFAAQAIFENFLSGLILLGERSIKPGDVLEVDGQLVRVEEMKFRATIVRTRDEEEMILPNSLLVQGTVKNYTLRDSRYRLRTRVGVLYSSDMRLVETTLFAAARSLEWRLPDREPRVLLVEFSDSAVVWDVSVWIDDPWEMLQRLSALNQTLWWALAEEGVVIAFPQLDLHLDARVEELLAGGEATTALS